MQQDLSLPIIYSIAAHLFLIVILTLKALIFPESIEPYESAIRVEIIDLPDKFLPPIRPISSEINTLTQAAEAPNEEIPKKIEEKVKEPDLVLNPNIKSKKEKVIEVINPNSSNAIKKLKKQMAIDKIKEEIKLQEREALNDRLIKYKGSQLAPGTEFSGIVKLQHENYLKSLDNHVKQFWSLPEWLARGNYSAQVQIFIDDKGLLLKTQMLRGSGNSDYDDIVLETLKKSVPFPVPPEKFRAIVSVSGIVLGFPE